MGGSSKLCPAENLDNKREGQKHGSGAEVRHEAAAMLTRLLGRLRPCSEAAGGVPRRGCGGSPALLREPGPWGCFHKQTWDLCTKEEEEQEVLLLPQAQ